MSYQFLGRATRLLGYDTSACGSHAHETEADERLATHSVPAAKIRVSNHPIQTASDGARKSADITVCGFSFPPLARPESNPVSRNFPQFRMF